MPPGAPLRLRHGAGFVAWLAEPIGALVRGRHNTGAATPHGARAEARGISLD